ncbi:MAG: ornithine cyclodeaminase family protein [Chloroflexi bacterium]|nr:ornithine cyclodeaminase family protein [Chloroflexota bacterium]
MSLLYLSKPVVDQVLNAADVVRIAEETLRAHAEGEITWSEPRILTLDSDRFPARYRGKLAAVNRLGVAGFRCMGTVPGADYSSGDPERFVLLSDLWTGRCLAIVDERWGYALRTGAGVAVAMKYLAPPGTDTVGLLGAGHMARGTLHTLNAVLPLRRAYVTSRSPASRERFAAELSEDLGLEVVPLASVEAVMAAADVVAAVTTATTPIVRSGWLRSGGTLYAMSPGQEVETAAYFDVDKLVVDDWEQVLCKPHIQAMVERGQLDRSHVHADLAQIVSGARAARERPDERILILSEGMVTMDVALSHHLYQKALALGLGQQLEV